MKRMMNFAAVLLLFFLITPCGDQYAYAQTEKDENGAPYPRLGMWWLDPYTSSAGDMSRYDLLLDSFEGQDLQVKLQDVRKLNPAIKVIKPLSPSERVLFWEYAGEEIPNPEIKDLPSSFFLLQVGSELTEAVGAEDTQIYVRDMYYENGVPRFHVDGEVAIGDNESALVTDIDYDNNCLMVERGYVRESSAHGKGTHIASHIRFWPGSWVMNVTDACPREKVAGMKKKVNWIEYFYNLSIGNCSGIYEDIGDNDSYTDMTGCEYSGIVLDRFEDKESWLKWNYGDEEIQIDLKHNNKDVTDTVFDASWRKGTERLSKLLKKKYPDKVIIRNNPLSLNYSKYNGQVYETGGWTNPDNEWWSSLFAETDSEEYYNNLAYLEWFRYSVPPLYVLMEVYEDEIGPDPDSDGEYDNPFDDPDFVPNYQRMRFSLTSALLGDEYFSYEINTNGHGSLGLMWFDEYDNAGENKGYLGYPLDECKILENGVYQRAFDNGLVLVNPQDFPVTVALESEYRKIKGTQVPEINDGKLTDRVELDAFDGLILLQKEKPK